jgi:hypothetical protein
MSDKGIKEKAGLISEHDKWIGNFMYVKIQDLRSLISITLLSLNLVVDNSMRL